MRNYILIALVRSMLHRHNTVPGIRPSSAGELLNGTADVSEQRTGTSKKGIAFSDERDLVENHCFRLFPFFSINRQKLATVS